MLTLYHNKSDKIVLNKSLTKIADIESYQIFNKDVVAPVYNISYSESFSKANYLYDSANKRYYYIKEISEKSGGELILACEVDVLMSFSSEIKNCYATIDRNEFERNGYLNDGKYQAYAYNQIVAKKFPKGMYDDSIILMTIG